MRNKIIAIVFLCISIVLLNACKHQSSIYKQDNYGIYCVESSKTRDELDLCFAKSIKQEHIQNDLINSFSDK